MYSMQGSTKYGKGKVENKYRCPIFHERAVYIEVHGVSQAVLARWSTEYYRIRVWESSHLLIYAARAGQHVAPRLQGRLPLSDTLFCFPGFLLSYRFDCA
jgi:hypothetical protein